MKRIVCRKCNKCGKAISVYMMDDSNGNITDAVDLNSRYVDKWGYARNFCKDCMSEEG